MVFIREGMKPKTPTNEYSTVSGPAIKNLRKTVAVPTVSVPAITIISNGTILDIGMLAIIEKMRWRQFCKRTANRTIQACR